MLMRGLNNRRPKPIYLLSPSLEVKDVDRLIPTLLVCADAQALSAIDGAAKGYEIQTEVCFTASEAFNVLRRRRFKLLVLDLDLPKATDVLRYRSLSSRDHPNVVIALASKGVSLKQTVGEQIHLVVQKPFTASLMERSLRSAYRLLLNETRATFRYSVDIIAAAATVVEQGRKRALQNVILRDLSSTGLRAKADSPLPTDSTVFVDFLLPGTEDKIHAVGRVIWANTQGDAGIQFISISAQEFQKLREWLSTRCPWTIDLPLKAVDEARGEDARSMQ
jgi:hypothetical protein